MPFAWSLVMIQIYYTMDFVLLGFMKNSAAVGEYAVAYRIPQALIAFGSLWIMALYPHSARVGQLDRFRLRREQGRAATIAICLASPIVVGAALLGRPLLAELFGSAFKPAAAAFVILIANAAVVGVCINFGNTLLAVGAERVYSVGVTAGAVVNLALNFVLIPRFGIKGSALATLFAEIVVLAYMLTGSSRELGSPCLDVFRIGKGLAAAGVMGVIVFMLRGVVPAAALVAVGALVFGSLALALRIVDTALPVGWGRRP
jgi:O-antigen/teichoic acid export membrane protein